ncbi:hypothetical protein FDC49_20495 [Clostridium sporogenes]|uniref:hypothetical protein n=1 Tax=Clostridium sporogenes TaxID=1509 RepID=UPI0013D6CF16|nr:hypothetical protein [Clostridium sporogenes]NFH34580.1 hypothetical protein [Clostridium sporogenes]NFL22071.1 hypothetical protein [Clostridium sporogenes]NFN75304.1 hypothetical protein [Clostridium sporogenes]NFV24547.1 hypothetical protein [Clostridium sporogenes]
MIFLSNVKKITDTKYLIFSIHFKPFDEVDGLDQTKEELEKKGFLIENDLYIEQESIEGKRPVRCWNPKENKMYYEYEDIPNNKDDLLQERLSAVEKSNAEMMNLIATMAAPTE